MIGEALDAQSLCSPGMSLCSAWPHVHRNFSEQGAPPGGDQAAFRPYALLSTIRRALSAP